MSRSARVALFAASLIGCLSGQALASAPVLDLLVSRDAVYRVSYEELAAQGLKPQPRASLHLSAGGEPVPVWFEGAESETFGPGSQLVFVGRHLRGANTHYDENSRHQIYRLQAGGARPVIGGESVAGKQSGSSRDSVRVVQRHEHDRVRVRFNPRQVEPQAEIWYWQRLSVLDKQPFEFPVDLGDAARFGDSPVTLRVNLRGWSFTRSSGEVADHRVELLFNGETIGSAEWNGQDSHTLEVERVPAALLRSGENRLSLRVPQRRNEKDEVLVDAVLFNWAEVVHPFDGHLEPGQLALRIEGPSLQLAEPSSGRVEIYSAAGDRVRLAPGSRRVRLPFEAPGDALLLVGEPEKPDAIRVDVPSDLRTVERHADYLMIAHSSLLEAARPLAEFHRGRGLEVALVDVQDIYDEFNHGVLSPYAIRDFISHAYHHWQSPRPRFVLLVGDASWENHGSQLDDTDYSDWTFQATEGRTGRFVRNGSTPYADLGRSRNLLPTLQAETWQGPAASDSLMVEIDGDDIKPDMAIGRLPVVEPADVAIIVRKLIDYETAAPVGPWRRSFLWIANEEVRMQRVSDQLAMQAAEEGLTPVKIYPESASKDNALYQQQLLQQFDSGNLLVHFFGHGGRYIWRTGPPDPKKNHDLFTLNHLDKLQSSPRLPVVLSMTCYSAPYDHPTADSIGEKFLRSEGRGAIGVFAASWRNSPTHQFSDSLVRGMAQRGGTVGEAIMNAKRETRDRILVQTYNYLGDPATRLSLPANDLSGSVVRSGDGLRIELQLDALPELRTGMVVVDLLDAQARPIRTMELPMTASSLRLEKLDPEIRDAVVAVMVYAWNEASGIDGIAHFTLAEAPMPVPAAP